MNKASSRCLVIDADVVCSASERSSPDPVPGRCLDFLLSVFSICHKVVLTPEIEEEWDEHQSGFGMLWRASMHDHSKVIPMDSQEDYGLRSAIKSLSITEQVQNLMLKDCHLIEAALAADCVIVSRDRRARRYFAAHASSLSRVREVVWVDPVESADDAIVWLENGAPPDNRYQLKHYKPEE